MFNSPFEDNNAGQSMPGMLSGMVHNNTGFNPEDFRYRVERFEMGSQDTEDEAAAFEQLLDRSLTPDLFILERKDSISATTGVYSCIIIYLERRTAAQGGADA